MSDFQPQYTLWDEFLSVWPASRLATMSLDDYSQAGSKDSFTYWIESRLDELGSIRGGSSFKFGVFSRKDTGDRQSDAKLSYSDTHSWYSSLGATAQEAFEKVRGFVVQLAGWAAEGNLDAIESFKDLGEAFKWKIAFHYQNRQKPVIVNIFTRAPLSIFVGNMANWSMASLQQAALTKRPEGLGILEFGHQVWEAWSQKNLAIWKLSHGSLTDAERQQCLDTYLGVMGKKTGKEQGKQFAEAPMGSLFFLCHGNSPQLIAQFTSDVEPWPQRADWLQRSYRVLKLAQRTDRYTVNSKYWSPQGNTTFWQVGADDLPEFESTLLKPYFGTDLAELVALVSEPIEETRLGHVEALSSSATPSTGNPCNTACFNRIYYGPPGTGKTYTLMQLLKRDYESQGADISMQDRQAQFIVEHIAKLKWWEGAAAALHDLGGRARVPELAEHPFIQAIANAKGRKGGIKQTLWGTLQHHTVPTSSTVNIKLRMSPAIFDKTADSIWHFAGEWEDIGGDLKALVEQFRADHQGASTIQRYSFVTFHQSYGYEEFVEGLRPVLIGDDDESGEVGYEIRPGAFKELCRKARQVPDQRFAMVIDEINRGNISKIFGELITLIEPDKREGMPNAVSVTLPYSGEKFSVPANVDIIGTMNTADRSLALLDTALRRRFDFVPLLPDTRAEKISNEPCSAPLAGLIVTTPAGEIDVRRMLERINERIEVLYDREHCIGHAYFTHLRSTMDGAQRFEALSNTFRNRILPLLEEYFFEDWHKIQLVLGDNQKPDTARFITKRDADEQALHNLFGDNHGLDSYSIQHHYQLQPSAFTNPASYRGIYEPLV